MEQNPVTEQDPLAAFMPQAQGEQPSRFQFAGQEFESQSAAEKWAAEQWEAKAREAQQAQATLQAMQNMRQQPATTQYTTGKETANWDHAKWLQNLAEDPNAIKTAMKYHMFGDANAQQDPFELMRASIAEAARLRQEVTLMNLKTNHPEINWNDQQQTGLIGQAMQFAGGSAEGAIAILQRDGYLPTRQQWQAKAQPVSQGSTTQQQPAFQSEGRTAAPPMMARASSVAPTGAPNVEAILAKMEDPSTSLEESTRLHAALVRYYEENPSAGGL